MQTTTLKELELKKNLPTKVSKKSSQFQLAHCHSLLFLMEMDKPQLELQQETTHLEAHLAQLLIETKSFQAAQSLSVTLEPICLKLMVLELIPPSHQPLQLFTLSVD